jgi:type IX secretion system PorP/SprF family membrane protein
VQHPFILIIAIFLLLHGGITKAQDPQFSQIYSSALYANPAFTGSAGQGRVQAVQRIQWPGIPGAFYTTVIALDISPEKSPLDFGLIYVRDQAGEATLTTQVIGLNLGRSFTLFRNVSLRIGGASQFNQRNLDTTKLVHAYMVDTSSGNGTSHSDFESDEVRFLSYNAGFLINSNTFLLAFGMHNINEPDQGFLKPVSRLPIRYNARASIRIFNREAKRSSRLYVNASFVKQQQFRNFMTGFSLQHGKVKLGLSYRNRDAYIAMLGFAAKSFTAAYSYDYTISRLTSATASAHEITLAFYFGKMQEKRASLPWTKELF